MMSEAKWLVAFGFWNFSSIFLFFSPFQSFFKNKIPQIHVHTHGFSLETSLMIIFNTLLECFVHL